VLGASLLGWTTPFAAIQIAWPNLIRDEPPSMNLGVEPARDVLDRIGQTLRDRSPGVLVASIVLWREDGRKRGLRRPGRMREPAQRAAA